MCFTLTPKPYERESINTNASKTDDESLVFKGYILEVK